MVGGLSPYVALQRCDEIVRTGNPMGTSLPTAAGTFWVTLHCFSSDISAVLMRGLLLEKKPIGPHTALFSSWGPTIATSPSTIFQPPGGNRASECPSGLQRVIWGLNFFTSLLYWFLILFVFYFIFPTVVKPTVGLNLITITAYFYQVTCVRHHLCWLETDRVNVPLGRRVLANTVTM